tara:strand:- start:7749 stop:8495 length:747 start_codon:yes stop_codon:yes gene_type:complete
MSFTSCLNNAACPEATHILLHKTPVSQAFLRNKNIECVKIAPKVESLKGRMFESTNIQTIEFQSPSSSKLTEVKSYAFRDCSELNNVVLPDSLKKLEDHAFMNTKNLTTIFIPGGVEMEAKVFSGASPLKNIVTPQGIGMITAHTVPDGGYNIVNGEFVAGKPNGQPTCGTQPAGVAPTTTAKPTPTTGGSDSDSGSNVGLIIGVVVGLLLLIVVPILLQKFGVINVSFLRNLLGQENSSEQLLGNKN